MPKWLEFTIWVAAFGLAIAGGIWYVLSPSDFRWWVGGLLGFPLAGLILWRAEKDPERRTPTYGGESDGGPWVAP